MMCNRMFAVVFFVLTGCLSAMALHTGYMPKNIYKRQASNVCENNQNLTTVTIDKTKALSLTEFNSTVTGKLLESALFVRETATSIPSKTVRIVDITNSDNFKMTYRKKPAQSACTTTQEVTLEHISGESNAVFTINRDSNDHLVAMFSSCTAKYIWRFMCGSTFDGSTFECPRSDVSLDLFLVENLSIKRAPMAAILEDLKEVTGIEWMLQHFDWKFSRTNDHCAIP